MTSLLGTTEKLEISGGGKKFTVMVNPNSISYDTSICYNKDANPQGTAKPEQKFDKTADETISFKIILDGTGVIDPDADSVADQITNFKEVTYDYKGDKHEPNQIEIAWGSVFQFDGKLKSLKIEYKLFNKKGEPLRADLDVSFVGSTDKKTEEAGKNTSSPDLSHVRTSKKGDTLPLMCQNIYGDVGPYLEVARINGITNFRSLEPGTEILFPPIQK